MPRRARGIQTHLCLINIFLRRSLRRKTRVRKIYNRYISVEDEYARREARKRGRERDIKDEKEKDRERERERDKKIFIISYACLTRRNSRRSEHREEERN